MIGPETFNEFASKQVEKFIKEPQNQHLSSLAFFQFCIHLNDKRFFLVVKPQFLQNTKAKEDYINAYKTYLKLKRDNCLVDIEEKYCSFKYNFFKLSQFDVPLNVYLQKQKINQVFLIRFALLLLKSIRKCHEKVYFIEHIKSSTVYIDTRKQNVLLINPIQKIILEQEKLINMKTSQVNQHKKIQTQTPKSTVLDLINKDSKDFIKTFLNVIGIDNLNFQEMHECNVLSSFFKRNFSGKITDSMHISHEQKTSEQLRANDQQNNQQEQTYLDELQSNQSANNADSQIKLDQEQILSNTFYQSEFCNCLKDQTSWLNCIYKIEMTQDQAYFLWKKLDKVKEKSSQQWIMTAWIQFKYFKFFKEPLQIIHNQVLKLKNNNCPQKQKEQNQQQGTKSAEINSQSYCLIGIIYWKWKKYQKAVQAFNTALKIDKRNQYALYYLGKNSFLFDQNFFQGNQYLFQLLQVNPYNQDLIRKICKFKQNDYYWYFLAIIAQPNCYQIILNLAQQYLDEGDYKLALFFCAKGINLNKNEKKFYFILAQIFIIQNNLKQSQKFLIKSQNSSNKEVSGYLVGNYRYMGDLEETEINFYKDLNSVKYLNEVHYTNDLYA